MLDKGGTVEHGRHGELIAGNRLYFVCIAQQTRVSDSEAGCQRNLDFAGEGSRYWSLRPHKMAIRE